MLTSAERLGRGAALVLFLAMLILAGVFIEASFTGGRSKLSSPAAPGKSVLTSPPPISADPTHGIAPAPVRAPTDAPSIPVQPGVAASPPGPPPPPAAPLASTPSSRPATPSDLKMLFAAPTTSAPDRATAAGPTLTASEIRALLSQGDALLRAGDVASARLFYQRRALAGDETAALRLAQAFDPVFLARAHLRSEPSDLGMAVFWYRRAQELGNLEAGVFLRRAEIAARSRWKDVTFPPNRHQRR